MTRGFRALSACGLLAGTFVTAGAMAAEPLSERTIAVDGRSVHVEEGGTGPSVVFESGLGEDLSTWSHVLPGIAASAHVFAYDRAGLGKSDPSPAPRTIEQMAAELHGVLLAARVPAPWILVGHSLGGAIAEVFAHRYPREVAGLVLVDPEDGRLDEMLRSRMPAPAWEERAKAVEKAMPSMPPPVRAELEAYRASASLPADAFEVGKIPVVLLTGTKKNPEFPGNPLEQDVKRELHERWLANAPGAKHVLVPQSRHYIQNDAPTEVVDAVADVLRRASGGARRSD